MKPLTEGLAIAVAILFAVGSALGAPRPARPESTQSPKHVLLIVPSDQGASDIGYVDSTFYTPTLNQLAAAGIKLSNMHTSSTDTGTRALRLSRKDPREPWQIVVKNIETGEEYPFASLDRFFEFLNERLNNTRMRTALGADNL